MIINNVKLILENEVVSGSLAVENGVIQAFSQTPSQLPEAIDGEGGWLMPGMVELHTDNLDKFFTPRPKVDWPAHSAMSSHDALVVANGITTVLDAIGVGDVRDGGHRLENLQKMINAIRHSEKHGLNRAEHRLHLRCELPHDSTLPLFEQLMCLPELSLVSLMDHSPGQRQYTSLEKYRVYFQGKYNLNDAEMDQFESQQLRYAERWSLPNRQAISAWCRQYNIPLASHDDATLAHVLESKEIGSVIAEFPTTEEAARASREAGLQVLMGAPNIVRGGSHSGNVAAHDLAALGMLDILSSDYYPASLLEAAFRLARDERNDYQLPATIAMVTRKPAQAIGMNDRGVIAGGKRADLVLVKAHQDQVYVRSVWVKGRAAY
ncbi:alpha-D-ribose 1-methylphosphonate 5-triphosphate diphosphatase [Erwinia amylovora]